MELKLGDLHDLVERAWALHEMVGEEINKTSTYSLCRLCSENGLYCGIAEAPFQEREGLVAIRDSLKQVWDSLLLLQKLRQCQPKDRVDALARLEESRLALARKVTQYQGRPLDVVRELNTSFNNWNSTALDRFPTTQKTGNQNVNHPKVNQVGKNPESGFWTVCLKLLLNPWRWKRAVGVAAKLAVVFASVSSTVSICTAKQKRSASSPKSAVPLVGSTGVVVYISQDSPLDVFRGRG